MHPYRACYRPTDIQKMLNISRTATYRLCQEPDFPSCKVGGTVLINPDGFDEWLKKHGLWTDDRKEV